MHPTHKNKQMSKQRGAGFSSLSFQEKPAAPNSKFFQASIGKHLSKKKTKNKQKRKQPTAEKITCGRRRQPFRG